MARYEIHVWADSDLSPIDLENAVQEALDYGDADIHVTDIEVSTPAEITK